MDISELKWSHRVLGSKFISFSQWKLHSFLSTTFASCPPSSCCPDVWKCLADLCNVLANVDHEEVPLYKADTEEGEGDEELTVLQLKEDRLLAGFVPLLAAPQEPCYIDRHTDTVGAMSGDIPAFQSHHLRLDGFFFLSHSSDPSVHMYCHVGFLSSGNSGRL